MTPARRADMEAGSDGLKLIPQLHVNGKVIGRFLGQWAIRGARAGALPSAGGGGGGGGARKKRCSHQQHSPPPQNPSPPPPPHPTPPPHASRTQFVGGGDDVQELEDFGELDAKLQGGQ